MGGLYIRNHFAAPLTELDRTGAILRKAEARRREALIEAVGRAVVAITSWDTRGFFEHCGYRSLGQLLLSTL